MPRRKTTTRKKSAKEIWYVVADDQMGQQFNSEAAALKEAKNHMDGSSYEYPEEIYVVKAVKGYKSGGNYSEIEVG